MRQRGLIIIGGFFLVLGLLSLLSTLLNVDFGALCFPLFLIFLGLLIIFRPRMIPAERGSNMRLLGDVKYYGDWTPQDLEIWSLVGNVRLDLSQAHIPEGETEFRIISFVGDTRLIVPPEIGVAVSSTGFVGDVWIFDSKYGGLLSPVTYASEDYASSQRRVHLETISFVGTTRVKRA
jgi:lia operon protein LiaF